MSPQWGPRNCQLLATPGVTLSLALFALGGSDLIGVFHLGTLSICRGLSNCRPVLDMISTSHDVEGALYEELGWRINSCVLRIFIAPARAHRFASTIVTP
jgi:hypothetical protein